MKFAVNDTFWPAAIFNGKDIPLKVNSELLEVAEETVTLAPAALSVPVKLLPCPTATPPKFRVVAATVN